MTARKDIMAALLALLAPVGGLFATAGRRLRDPEHAGKVSMPALYLIKPTEHYERSSRNLPAVRRMEVMAIVYTDVGDNENAVPADALDDLLDGIDTALAPAPGDEGLQTLGGLVYNVIIDGDVDVAPGDELGKGTAVIPIQITLLPL